MVVIAEIAKDCQVVNMKFILQICRTQVIIFYMKVSE